MDSNKVSMELLNLEVINRNRLGKFFPFNGFNKRRAAAQQFKLIADLQGLSASRAPSQLPVAIRLSIAPEMAPPIAPDTAPFAAPIAAP